MQRKIIKQGVGGNTIFLPKFWVQEHHLKPGDTVDVLVKDGNLIITGKGAEAIKTKEVLIPKSESLSQVRTIIASAYKSGYNEIVLHFPQPVPFFEISKIVNTFTGLEIVSHSAHVLKIRSFLKVEAAEIENIMVKMFQMTKILAGMIIEDSTFNEKDLRSARENIRKVRDHCLRMIHTSRFAGDLTYDYYDLVTQLEKVAADFSLVGIYLQARTIKTHDKKLLQSLFQRFELCYQVYLKKEFNLANQLWVQQQHEVRKNLAPSNLYKLTRSHDPVFVVYYYHLQERYLHLASRLVSICSEKKA